MKIKSTLKNSLDTLKVSEGLVMDIYNNLSYLSANFVAVGAQTDTTRPDPIKPFDLRYLGVSIPITIEAVTSKK